LGQFEKKRTSGAEEGDEKKSLGDKDVPQRLKPRDKQTAFGTETQG
jgi:hypothetical protein